MCIFISRFILTKEILSDILTRIFKKANIIIIILDYLISLQKIIF